MDAPWAHTYSVSVTPMKRDSVAQPGRASESLFIGVTETL